jgi:glycogen(starch) synthase
VSATGGLAEIVRPGVTGVTFRAADDVALAEAVGMQLGDRGGALRMARAAGLMVRRRFGWDTVAERTAGAYQQVLVESAAESAAEPGIRAARAARAAGATGAAGVRSETAEAGCAPPPSDGVPEAAPVPECDGNLLAAAGLLA